MAQTRQTDTTPNVNPPRIVYDDDLLEKVGISLSTLQTATEPQFWLDYIDLSTNPTDVQLQSHVGAILQDLRTTKARGQVILDDYMETFEQWEKDHFGQLGRAFKRELVLVLEEKGIIAEGNPRTQVDKLYDIAQGKAIVIGNGITHVKSPISTPATQDVPQQQPQPALSHEIPPISQPPMPQPPMPDPIRGPYSRPSSQPWPQEIPPMPPYQQPEIYP